MINILTKSIIIITLFLSVTPSNAQKSNAFSLLLKGGLVIDPSKSINGVMDIAVSDGKIIQVAENIPVSCAVKIVDITGYIVTPGLIDIHGHVFHTFDHHGRWVIADHHSFQSGVTTVVDAGTSGADNFHEFKKIIDGSRTRILAFLNIAAPGKNSAQNNPAFFDVHRAVETAKSYPDIIVGFKSCDYLKSSYNADRTPWASVDSVLAAGRSADLPVMISFYPSLPEGIYPPRSYHDLILKKMRPGDIHTCFFSPAIPVILDDGKLNPDIIEARQRGVLFDGTHGTGSLVFRNLVPAVKQGFTPDTISTDLHGPGRMGAVVDLLNVMSKFLCAGISLEDVICCTTYHPARTIQHNDLGTLSVGSIADIAVIEQVAGNFRYVDTGGGTIIGDKKLQIIMTVFDGEIVFDPYGISAENWETISRDSNYWKNPTGFNR